MKLQLSITLLVSLLHCSFAEVANVPDEFCDEGPPGKYCLPDLTGWHNCYIDKETGKMVDKITSCSPNTRYVTPESLNESKSQRSHELLLLILDVSEGPGTSEGRGGEWGGLLGSSYGLLGERREVTRC